MEVGSEQKERTNSEAGGDWPSKGLIEFRNVSLFYGPKLPPALKNLSFVIQDGLQVVIVRLSLICFGIFNTQLCRRNNLKFN